MFMLMGPATAIHEKGSAFQFKSNQRFEKDVAGLGLLEETPDRSYFLKLFADFVQ